MSPQSDPYNPVLEKREGVALTSDCADAQVGLGLHNLQMPEDLFSRIASRTPAPKAVRGTQVFETLYQECFDMCK